MLDKIRQSFKTSDRIYDARHVWHDVLKEGLSCGLHGIERLMRLNALPRRTKVEQIRDRDLIMPQEVRQMPEDKMILLVEGQRPIFGDKLRFFRTQPFKEAEAYSQTRIPTAPTVDYLPPKPVPATTPAYANAGQELTEEAEAIKLATEAKADGLQAPTQKETPKEPAPSTSPARVVNPSALASKKVSAGDTPEPARAPVPAPEKRTTPVSENDIEKAHNDRVSRLREVVEREAEGKSPRKRKSLEELFAATVPDLIMEQAGR